MKHSYPDPGSLMAEWNQQKDSSADRHADKTEAEKAEALREYQKLVERLDDALREREEQRRTGAG